jgi:hypothetical protein
MTTFKTPKNWVASTLAAAIGVGDLSITVATGEGSLFGASFPMTLVIDYNLPSSREIVLATARTGDVIDITRAQEGTSAATHTIGAAVRCNLTAGQITDLHTAINAVEGFVGSDGEIHLTPKVSSSSSAEGTIFYDSDDDHVYVGTE